MEELEKSLNETHLSVATDNASASEYVPSEVTNTSVDTLPDEVKDLHLGVTVATCNMQLMEKFPRVFVGLDKETMFLVPLLQKHTGLDKRNIFVALRKIRLNESSEVLGHIFWLHRSSVCRIVNESIPKIARFMATCIKWPSPQIIQSNVPLAFRAHYSTVQSILDCFEVEIEKFSNPLFQSLTWSEYKKRNTIKFLISSTPDGLINFISGAYGGRATDCNILRDSGYLEVLPRNTLVMADRGFKNVESLISDSGSRLVRPPSVHTEEKTVKKGNSEKVIKETVKMTKRQVRGTKVIASLRIVIERVIGRLRNFEMVDHAANFHHDLLSLANNIVVIVCGLSNLQGPLFL
ncbi:uncharacterized protein [Bemisia tabaci]|uniref:uncharacterized protein n=1 Tax=Bemisia tabaci TaxID=7038 RepID=UPI003B28BC20